ncbi:GNAT family N-acetyltransferase [Paenibacillus sp. R14(2021)]|uniref:GNAT family N-acetyltransferase n=1 Tax=Paenibacillus sp. R14(2021) TaxID=2859228 RepID=UPI001C614572|nr:GNAT family N-acetyltransferase [Paenibacillus sp. R14(2021)]
MIEIRLLTEEEMQGAADGADAVFRDRDMSSMKEAFPFIFNSRTSHSHGLFMENELLVFMGLVPATARLGSARLSVLSLGAVYAVEAARNKGYASRLLEAVKTYGRQAGASLLLVSGDGPLYSRAGCRKFGDAYRFELNRAFAEANRPDSVKLQTREALHRDELGMHRLAAERRSAFEQSIWDFSVLIRTESNISGHKMKQRVYLAGRDGSPDAFAVIAHPTSLSNQPPRVIEWAGEPGALLKLLAHVMLDTDMDRLTFTVTASEHELLGALNTHAFRKERIRNQGTLLVLDAARLIDQLRPYLEEAAPSSGSRLSARSSEDGSTVLSLPGLPDAVLTHEELVSLFFDAKPGPPLPDGWGAAAASLFPLPFPYTDGLNFI